MSQYSPLAAAGGYRQYQKNPWDLVVDYFNPHHLNLHDFWEERRQNWLDNVAYNEYFWYAYWTSILLILCMFALWWVWDDKVQGHWDLAENAADALRYAELCKREAKDAIRRYQQHADKCNRIVEHQRSGMVTPETANLQGLNQQIQALTSEKQAAEFQVSRLNNELKSKDKMLSEMTSRLSELENHVLNPKPAAGPNDQMVERANRAEAENRQLQADKRRLQDELRQLRTQQRQAAATTSVSATDEPMD